MAKVFRVLLLIFCVLLLVAGLFVGFLYFNDYHIEMALQGEEKITLEYGESFADPGATAVLKGKWHLKKGRPLEVFWDGDVNDQELGSYIISYTAEAYRMHETISREISVVDNKKPTLSLKGKKKVTITEGGKYEEAGVLAKDNYDGDLSKSVEIKGKVDTKTPGTYSLTYSVKDSSGNSVSVKREIVVKKKIVKPVVKPAAKPSGKPTVSPSAGVKDPVTVIPGVKTVYLTFDDGPGPYTAKLLDILKKYNAKATFFVNNKSNYNDLLPRMANEGHAIGLHTASHNYNKIYASEAAFFADLEIQQNVLQQKIGRRTNLLRFPGGSSNTISRFNPGIMTRLTKLATEKGYRYFDWNVFSGDAGETTSTSRVAQNVIRGISKKRVSVVLQHDTKGFSVNAVEEIIKWGKANGYKFEACSSTSPTAHHGLHN